MKVSRLVLVLLCSCIVSEAEEDDLSETTQLLKPNCDDIGCGSNSPHLENGGFHFLLTNGRDNPQRYSIAGFTKPGDSTPYTFSVLDGEIRAMKSGRYGAGPVVAYDGSAVVGMELHINFRGVPKHVITITGYERLWSWARKSDNSRFFVHTYRFHWTNSFGQRQNLCSHPGNSGETLGMNEYFTVVFEGDVIKAREKVVDGAIDNNVVNFGCAGSALAKLHLSGYTEVAARLGFATTTSERQTMLKMITADYCGDGIPYTVGGQPLYWLDDNHWNLPLGSGTREALWNENGAVCLNQPRMLANPSTDTAYWWPEIVQRSDIPCASALPLCPITALPTGGSPVLSLNPPP